MNVIKLNFKQQIRFLLQKVCSFDFIKVESRHRKLCRLCKLYNSNKYTIPNFTRHIEKFLYCYKII